MTTRTDVLRSTVAAEIERRATETRTLSDMGTQVAELHQRLQHLTGQLEATKATNDRCRAEISRRLQWERQATQEIMTHRSDILRLKERKPRPLSDLVISAAAGGLMASGLLMGVAWTVL